MPELSTTETDSVQIPEDFAAYERWRDGETAEAEPEKSAEGEEPTKTPAPAPEPEKKQEPTEEQPVPAGVQKRIDKAVARQREAERKAEELERRIAELQGSRPAPKENAKPAAGEGDGRPKPDQFETYDAYVEALTDWRVEQREQVRAKAEAERKAQESAQSAQAEWQKRAEAVKAKHADFEEVLSEAKIPISREIHEAILTDEHGPEVAYYLATHMDEAQRISGLSAVAAVRALGRLSAKFDSAPETKEKPAVSKAPKPPSPVSGAGKGTPRLDEEGLSFAEYEKLRMAELRRR